jgi:O-antigen ligase
VFGPVSLLRSVVDAKSDRSTLDRDLENFNLVATFANHPLIGVGMGQPYVEAVKGDDISHAFPEYRYVPHNSVLGLWAWGGLIGFLGFWTAPMVALLAAARHHRAALTCEQRVASFVVIAAVEIYMLQCWGDMGFVDPKAIFIGGAALGVAARLATFSAPAATVALGATR